MVFVYTLHLETAQKIAILSISRLICAVFKYRSCKCFVFMHRKTRKVGETFFAVVFIEIIC
jgi:hypothetical protein